MLHGTIALFVGLFFVAQIWLAILESRVGPFSSHWLRAAILVTSLTVPSLVVLLPAWRARRWPAMPSRAALVLLGCVLISTIWLFQSVQPFHPDHDDTFRAGFAQAILNTGFPPSLRWWVAGSSGHVHYYVLAEDIVAQVKALVPSLSLFWLYIHQLKLAYLVCTLLLGYSIARDLGALDRLVVPGRVGATVCQMVVAWCAFSMLAFGATPFELATMHVLGVSQSAIVHPILLVFIALVVRRPRTQGGERLALDVTLWTLPAVLVAAKLPYVPAIALALGIDWLLEGELRARRWRALWLPVYCGLTMALATASVGLGGAAEKHPLGWLPLRLFQELDPRWFHFSNWPAFWRISVAFGLYDAPIFLLVLLLARSREPLATRLRSPTARAMILVTAIMLAGYAASATIGFADREGANELYWFVQGWSALSVLVFLVVISAPASWSKLLIVPFALYAVHANWMTLRHSMAELYPPIAPAAVDACAVADEWAAARDDHALSVVAHPFVNWDFIGCSALPTLAPPADRYDRITRNDPLLAPNRRYMQQLVAMTPLPPPPPELQRLLSQFAHVLIIRPRSRPLADATARLVGQRGELLFYDWPTRPTR